MSAARTYPIILAHGVCRFDVLSNRLFELDNAEDDRLHYFRGIRSMLREHGFEAWHSHVEWAAGVETRAKRLRRNLEQVLEATGAEKVHLVAHSMGGLDARHMLYRSRGDGLCRRVASVSTLGTPHWGSSFADWGLEHFHKLDELLARLGIDLQAFRDLQTGPCAAFNAEAAGFEAGCGVRFQTFAGTKPLWYVFAPLRLSAYVIKRREGENDGLVSLRSARWRDEYFQQCIDADHFNLTGWWNPGQFLRGETPDQFESRIRGFYLGIAEGLAERFPR